MWFLVSEFRIALLKDLQEFFKGENEGGNADQAAENVFTVEGYG